jgi:succinate-acetate transporter protein
MTATTGDSAARIEETPPAPPVPAPLSGNPALLGLPSFIVGSLALGMVLVGVVPTLAVGASLPIILAATSLGLILATIWSAAVGQSAVASVFGIFAGFWLSYAILVLGLTHNWFGAGVVLAAVSTQELFLVAWLVIIVLLTLATLRLPLAFTVLFGLIDVALLLVLLGVTQASTGLLKAGGYVVFAFAAVGVYLFYDATTQALGGKALPLGRPVISG